MRETTRTPDPNSSRRVERIVAAALLLSAVYPFLDLCRAAWSFTTDDAFISLRYAHFLAAGEGVRFNLGGPPVEGYSNFGFVLLAAGLLRLGLEPLIVLKTLGVLACPLTAFLLYRIATRHVSRLFATLPGVVYLAFPGTAWWAVSGLETTTYVFLVVLALWAFLPRPSARQGTPWLAGSAIALAGWLRPDGPLLGVVLVVVLLVEFSRKRAGSHEGAPGRQPAGTLRALALLAAGFLPLYAPYLAWRIIYFGHLLPNSVACKMSYSGSPWTVICEYLPVLIGSAAVFGWAGRKLAAPLSLACLLFNATTVVLLYGVDTTIAYGLRHFFAAFALLLLPVALGAHRLSLFFSSANGSRGWASMLVLHTLLWGSISLLDVEGRLHAFAQQYAARGQVRAQVAQWLRDELPEGASYVMGDVGRCGYLTPQLRLIDAYCLNNEALGRASKGTQTAVLTDQVLAQRPAALVLTSRSATTLQSRSSPFARVLADPRVGTQYKLRAVFGDDEDGFNYWIYQRTDQRTDPRRSTSP